MIVASAPTRLDFGGGWTDVPPFPEERGGFVCNLAIERRATVTLVGDASADTPSDPLVAAALRGADLRGVRVSLTNDFPVGAGLGGSSAAGVALQAAIAALDTYARDVLASVPEPARVLVTAHDAFGYFGRDYGFEVLGIPAETITAVLDAYRDRVPRVVAALDRMRELARAMAESLHTGNVSELAELVSEHWVHQQSLHPGISTHRIAEIERAVRAVGATGFKALGASGGGCVLAIAPVDRMDEVRRAVAGIGEVLAWRVARRGVLVSKTGG